MRGKSLSPAPVERRRDHAVERLLAELRRAVRTSDLTQRQIEAANGFTRGYLSQVLHGHVTLTARHVFGILYALELEPEAFFRRLFGEPRGEYLSEIRERMARYDDALEQLRERGLLPRPGEPGEGDL